MRKIFHLAVALLFTISLTTSTFAGRDSGEPAPAPVSVAPVVPVPQKPTPNVPQAKDPTDNQDNNPPANPPVKNGNTYTPGQIAGIAVGTVAAGSIVAIASHTIARRKSINQQNEPPFISLPSSSAPNTAYPVPNYPTSYPVWNEVNNSNSANPSPIANSPLPLNPHNEILRQQQSSIDQGLDNEEIKRQHEEKIDAIAQKHEGIVNSRFSDRNEFAQNMVKAAREGNIEELHKTFSHRNKYQILSEGEKNLYHELHSVLRDHGK